MADQYPEFLVRIWKTIQHALHRRSDDPRDYNQFWSSVIAQVAALWRVNEQEKWGILPEVFVRLLLTAPSWPKGRLAFRSLRLRFGEGSDGVGLTFRMLTMRALQVYDGRVLRDQNTYSGVNQLRLVAGDQTHVPIVEWILMDLETYRQRDSIASVCSSSVLADELLAFACLFPDYILVINDKEFPQLCAAGYACNVFSPGVPAWSGSLIISLSVVSARRFLTIKLVSSDDSSWNISVPTLIAPPVSL